MLQANFSEYNNGVQSISELESVLKAENRKLEAKDICHVKRICHEIADKADILKEVFAFKVEQLGPIMNRIKLYLSDQLEIRIHFFIDKEDNIIHQHGQSFITTNLTGRYDHNIFILQDSDDFYRTYERAQNGIFHDCGKSKGTWTNICSQPFDEGQTLYISPHAFHTVEIKKYPAITLVVRDREDTISDVKFISIDKDLTQEPLITAIDEQVKIDSIFEQFLEALKNFKEISG